MKTKKKIKLLEEALEAYKIRCKYLRYYGLCNGIPIDTRNLLKGKKLVKELTNKYKKDRTKFYDSRGVSTDDNRQFIWTAENKEVRIKFLEFKIAELKDEYEHEN